MPAAPEPGGWDLQRQIDRLREDLKADLKAAIDRAESHVTESGLAALLARYDDRIKYLGEDLAEERLMRKADITAEQDARKDAVRRLEETLARMVTTQRWVATAILLPVGLFIANLIFLFARS